MSEQVLSAHRSRSLWPAALAGAVAALLFGGTAWLWAHYGTAVFLETIRTGLAACFG